MQQHPPGLSPRGSSYPVCPQKVEPEKVSRSGYLLVSSGGWRADLQQLSPETTEACRAGSIFGIPAQLCVLSYICANTQTSAAWARGSSWQGGLLQHMHRAISPSSSSSSQVSLESHLAEKVSKTQSFLLLPLQKSRHLAGGSFQRSSPGNYCASDSNPADCSSSLCFTPRLEEAKLG